MSKAIEGRKLILECLAECGVEREPIALLELQQKYFERHGIYLNKELLRMFFGKMNIKKVFEKFMGYDVELTTFLYIRMKRPLAEALAALPSNLPKINVPPSQIMDQIGTLFGQPEFCDCIIVSADNKQFKVHKNILACRSPVFAAMFQHGMTEARNHTVKIPDFDSVVLEQMLQFIYNENAVICANIGDQLLAAADKYQLEGLKVLCERELSQSMSIENACKILILATFYSAEQLKFYALEYIRMQPLVKDTEGWKMLGKEHLDMLGQ